MNRGRVGSFKSMDNLAQDIEQQLTRYLAGQLSRQDFQAWLTTTTWGRLSHMPQTTRQLVGTIELLFAERARGHRQDHELHDLLVQLCGTLR